MCKLIKPTLDAIVHNGGYQINGHLSYIRIILLVYISIRLSFFQVKYFLFMCRCRGYVLSLSWKLHDIKIPNLSSDSSTNWSLCRCHGAMETIKLSRIVVWIKILLFAINGTHTKISFFTIFVCLCVLANLRKGWTDLDETFTGW